MTTILYLSLTIATVVAGPIAEAQQAKKIHKIGFLSASSQSSFVSASTQALLQELQTLGYVEGKNILIEYRAAEGKYDRLPNLVDELIGLKVELIIANSALAARPAKVATKKIPIVVYSGDPVGAGLVASLSHPGGNVTGVTDLSADLSGKRFELLKEIVPGLVRVAVLWDSEGPVPVLAFKETQEAARAMGLQIQSLEVRGPSPDFEAILNGAIKGRARALLVINNPLISVHRQSIVENVQKRGLPAIYPDRRFMEDGGLMSYGVDNLRLFARLAYFVDKILKGAKPADLPVEQPTKFQLIINLKTANQIGLAIPPNVLARADRVIR